MSAQQCVPRPFSDRQCAGGGLRRRWWRRRRTRRCPLPLHRPHPPRASHLPMCRCTTRPSSRSAPSTTCSDRISAAARSTDLMNWTLVADGVTNANPLFTNVLTELQETFAWSQNNDLWAPDVVRLADGKFYFYYDSCRGDSPLSALGVAVADSVNGPYVDKQIILKSGMSGLSEDGVTNYDARVHPNVIDPHTFFDANGELWMIYGSYSGGIFILAIDETTGLPEPGQGYGTHLMGGNHARIEGAYVIYNPQTGVLLHVRVVRRAGREWRLQHSRGALAGARWPVLRWGRHRHVDRHRQSQCAVRRRAHRAAWHEAHGQFPVRQCHGRDWHADRLCLTGPQLGVLRRGARQVLHDLPHALPGAWRAARGARPRDVLQLRGLAGGGAVSLRAAEPRDAGAGRRGHEPRRRPGPTRWSITARTSPRPSRTRRTCG